ncbi:putative pentatricopeptide repeat-containing protein At5g43820 [Chenopodium quinoa]|uniref:putative pentatricopeptide repeat-containing protein At5g43820 n=1 Tax=Chenopodium quinoa TaxID=63459 RepID=UPI000B77040D|nr:putative pentatricopeptide repeat-containing protein At5g43820 [Chenopodium quinoa]XP_021742573.1 putative pentatricopeptide repeat-containing protein At5g43820 [Chenopodium quinoa]
MTFSLQRFMGFAKNSRYSFYSIFSLSPFSQFSTIEASSNFEQQQQQKEEDEDDNLLLIHPTTSSSILDESKVLAELSNLLPVNRTTTIPNNLYIPNSEETLISVSPDGFLPLEDKLRGVFLQKLKSKALIENALTAALGDVQLSVDVVSRVLDRGNLGGDAMVLFFNWAIKHDSVGRDLGVYHVILKALGRRKHFDFMMDKFREMYVEGISMNCGTLELVMDSFIRSRFVSRAVELFRKLDEFGMMCGTEEFNVLLKCLCKRAHVGTANSLLNSMRGKFVFDCVTYNVVIGGWAKLGKVSEMKKCLEGMVEDGFCPDCETYSCLIEGLGKAGLVDDAVKIFKSMEGQGCQPNIGVYNAMIANYVSVGNFDECMKYYEEMSRNDCQPDVDTCAKIICGLIKARKVADALEMFDEMLRKGVIPTTGMVTSFIEPLCNYGPPYAAMIIYKNARKQGCRISLNAYKLLLMRLSRFGKCGMLVKLWDEIQESGYSADIEVYEYVVNGLCNNGQLEAAVCVMEEALRKGFCPSRLMYSKLNKKLMAFNKVDRAYKLFLKVKQARVNENARRYWRRNGWHF